MKANAFFCIIFFYILAKGFGEQITTIPQEKNTATNKINYLVVFSYNHPWGSDQDPNKGWTDPWFMDFSHIRLDTATIVDKVNPADYSEWKQSGRKVLARVHEPTPKSDSSSIIKYWDGILSLPGIDGLALDEFTIANATASSMKTWIEAIRTIRTLHPSSILYFWCSGITQASHKALLETLRDFADYIAPEIYYKESQAPDFASAADPFPRFRETVSKIERLAPGIKEKIIIGLGCTQTGSHIFDDKKNIDYGEFLQKQVEVCATDPKLDSIAGIAIYAPGYLLPSTLTVLNDAIKTYFGPRLKDYSGTESR